VPKQTSRRKMLQLICFQRLSVRVSSRPSLCRVEARLGSGGQADIRASEAVFNAGARLSTKCVAMAEKVGTDHMRSARAALA